MRDEGMYERDDKACPSGTLAFGIQYPLFISAQNRIGRMPCRQFAEVNCNPLKNVKERIPHSTALL
jgi:hypothetical protein